MTKQAVKLDGKTIGYVNQWKDSPLPMWHASVIMPDGKLRCVGGCSGKPDAKLMVRDAYLNGGKYTT